MKETTLKTRNFAKQKNMIMTADHVHLLCKIQNSNIHTHNLSMKYIAIHPTRINIVHVSLFSYILRIICPAIFTRTPCEIPRVLAQTLCRLSSAIIDCKKILKNLWSSVTKIVRPPVCCRLHTLPYKYGCRLCVLPKYWEC